ncbi:hypothetical protein D3C80_1017650 [compost metagenome]
MIITGYLKKEKPIITSAAGAMITLWKVMFGRDDASFRTLPIQKYVPGGEDYLKN